MNTEEHWQVHECDDFPCDIRDEHRLMLTSGLNPLPWGPLESFYFNTGLPFDWASSFNALIVFGEHRWPFWLVMGGALGVKPDGDTWDESMPYSWMTNDGRCMTRRIRGYVVQHIRRVLGGWWCWLIWMTTGPVHVKTRFPLSVSLTCSTSCLNSTLLLPGIMDRPCPLEMHLLTRTAIF